MSKLGPMPSGAECPRCLKPRALCVCDEMMPVHNRTAVLILQHPQEQDRALGTARPTSLQLKNAVLRIGLSWPSLAAALGRPADPKQWAVVYLGSAAPAELAPGREVLVLDRKGKPVPDQEAALKEIEGIVLLDGTWSQAKTLWWRNPWVLKARRIVLNPSRPSRYGLIRREPRRDSLSTLEAAGLALARIEGNPEIETALVESFERMLARARSVALDAEGGNDRRTRKARHLRRRRAYVGGRP
ncbi:MAG TPA: tRNA-uridine aminocarboxypropyltransferase [Stellaceae bacterium]|nr:tRNA-uridine aminocarboxypropyltransferase [Stellaceae bacterium]